MAAAGFRHAHQRIAFFERNRFNTLGAHVFKGAQLHFFHHALCGGEKHIFIFGEIAHRQNGAYFFAFIKLNHIIDRAPAAVAAAFGQLVNFNPMAFAQISETHQIIMGVGHKQGFDKVFVFGGCGLFAAPAAALRLIIGSGLGFDVAAVGERYHHFARRNQVFIGNIAAKRVDFTAALIAELGFDFFQLIVDDLGDALGLGQNIQKINNLRHNVFIIADNAVLIEAGKVTQAHAQNGIGLQLAQIITFALQAQIGRQAFWARHAQIEIGAAEHLFHQ